MPSKKLSAFISYSRKELNDYLAKAEEILERLFNPSQETSQLTFNFNDVITISPKSPGPKMLIIAGVIHFENKSS